MIEKITHDKISLTLPTVFGDELTFLEFCGKMRSKLNECIGVVNENTSDIQQNTTDIQQNTFKISRNEKEIVDLKGVVNSISAQADENTVKINTVSGKVDKNTTDIQKNTAAISANQSNITALSAKVDKNTTDIQQNTSAIQQNTTDIQQNTANIQQNTANISKNELSIATINAAFNELRTDFLKRKAEALFAPVILNVDPHSFGADINAAVYVRIGRISYDGLGCLYAKVNLSFSGATDAKTLKILSVQFGKRSIVSLSDPAPIFTAKTDVINIPISVVGSADIPVGTSNIAITGSNLFGSSENISDISSAIDLEHILTGKDILCDSLTFASPGGGESDPKFIHTLKISEGNMDIFTTGVGLAAVTKRSRIDIDFSSTISAPNIYDQFLCVDGVYDDDSISSIPANGVALGAALINYTEYTDNNHTYTARISIKNIDDGGTSLTINPTGVGSLPTPFSKFSHTSLTFDIVNY